MIAFISGEVIDVLESSLVVNLQGVGIQVFTTNEVLAKTKAGDLVQLHTILIVREDSLTLYGYRTKSEKELFHLLIGVNGVGPRLANTILSTMSVEAIRQAIQQEDALLISRVPGIGKKTAQKIILQLQGTFEGSFGELDQQTLVDHQMLADALTSLGYSVIEAQTAIQAMPKDRPAEIEEQIRIALKYLSGE
ncbi:MAG: Holliday junction branch migration protein RuvA [Anaerolineaceae bacterium]|nr:Holliday junction branch migration protein RuvA [Anaerolineaceae bacterium]